MFYYWLVLSFLLTIFWQEKCFLKLAYFSQLRNVSVTFLANFIFVSPKIVFPLNKFYCHGRLTEGVKNKETYQPFYVFLSMGHSFIQPFTRLVHTFFIYLNELITERTVREWKLSLVAANVEAKHDSFSFFKALDMNTQFAPGLSVKNRSFSCFQKRIFVVLIYSGIPIFGNSLLCLTSPSWLEYSWKETLLLKIQKIKKWDMPENINNTFISVWILKNSIFPC